MPMHFRIKQPDPAAPVTPRTGFWRRCRRALIAALDAWRRTF